MRFADIILNFDCSNLIADLICLKLLRTLLALTTASILNLNLDKTQYLSYSFCWFQLAIKCWITTLISSEKSSLGWDAASVTELSTTCKLDFTFMTDICFWFASWESRSLDTIDLHLFMILLFLISFALLNTWFVIAKTDCSEGAGFRLLFPISWLAVIFAVSLLKSRESLGLIRLKILLLNDSYIVFILSLIIEFFLILKLSKFYIISWFN